MTGPSHPPPPVGFPSEGLHFSELVPYGVAFTVVAGALAMEGYPSGTVPPLVTLCWWLFLLGNPDRWARGTRIDLTGLMRDIAPSVLICVTGLVGLISVSRSLTSGYWEFGLAICGAAAPWLLLPETRAKLWRLSNVGTRHDTA